ncbi:cobalamin biosynthesis protein [Tropicibacter sp. R15_0]|uniref:cobalamin biosynthesis protein n=1 Tax=Tropicibacter sp. R15_0 TaxID=2821101 RepID=UPI001ADC14B2|nr:cobalamin biosynthesis protein [Tropicibacter sp. R15_0]MBO9464682.1 cobalamin biosynthesis protein [Tropicibacter sp. R15_0]
MRVAGIGYRTGAPVSAMRQALEALDVQVDALAVSDHKTDRAALTDLARQLQIPLISVRQDELRKQQTLTQSPAQLARFGTGSLAEAAALAAAGTGAILKGPRVISPCGRATAAIAEGQNQ